MIIAKIKQNKGQNGNTEKVKRTIIKEQYKKTIKTHKLTDPDIERKFSEAAKTIKENIIDMNVLK